MNWTVRDWTSVVVGWVCGVLAVIFLPVEWWKLPLVFLAGFIAAWVARLLIPH